MVTTVDDVERVTEHVTEDDTEGAYRLFPGLWRAAAALCVVVALLTLVDGFGVVLAALFGFLVGVSAAAVLVGAG